MSLRRFENAEGFGDNVKYVVHDDAYGVSGGAFYLEMKDGTTEPSLSGYSLDDCQKFTDLGYWKEIKEPSCECNCEKETHTQRMVKAFADSGYFSEPDDWRYESVLTFPPIDFSTAQVGDTVRCLLNGDVKVVEVNEGRDFPIVINGQAIRDLRIFSKDGKLYDGHKNPCLIGFVDTDGKLCRTRPEPRSEEIDWSKVAIDAPVEVDGKVRHFAGMNSDNTFPMFWDMGRTSYTAGISRDGGTGLTYKLINTEGK